MDKWETVWRFDTNRFTVTCDVAPCEDDPKDVFGFDSDVEAVRNGEVSYFDARVRVTSAWGDVLGEDYLGACSYASIDDFLSGHRDRNPLNRNCSEFRRVKGENALVGHYFPDMVNNALVEARKRLEMLDLKRRS